MQLLTEVWCLAGGDGSYLEAEVREKQAQLEEVDRELSGKEQELREGESSCSTHSLLIISLINTHPRVTSCSRIAARRFQARPGQHAPAAVHGDRRVGATRLTTDAPSDGGREARDATTAEREDRQGCV